MKWPHYSIRDVAPAVPAEHTLDPSDTVWHLGLDQIESHTGNVLKKHRAPISTAGNSTVCFDESHVLYCKLRPYLNKVLIPDEIGIATTELIPLKPLPNLIRRDYLAYYLRSPGFLAYASQYVTGAKMPRVILDKFWEHRIPVPSLGEQERIVDILDQADRLRRLRAKADAIAARILPALFIRMFGDPATNPMGWPCRPLSDLAIKLSDGPFGSNLKTSHYTQQGVRVVRLQNVGVGHFLDEDKAFITPDHFASLAKHRCVPGDVIVATLGVPNLRACVLPDNLPEALNKADCIQMRPKHRLAVAEYVCWLLNASGTVGMAKRLIHGQTRTRISMGLLKGLSVPIPRYELQLRFASYVKETNIYADMCGNLNGFLSRLWNLVAHASFAQRRTASWR